MITIARQASNNGVSLHFLSVCTMGAISGYIGVYKTVIDSPCNIYMHITDTRLPKEFAKHTFSGYKRSEVCKALERSMMSSSVEKASFWVAELVCSGRFIDAWDTIINTYAQCSFMSSPKICVLLACLLDDFRAVINGQYVGNELDMRNVECIRICMARAVAAVSASKKGHAVKRSKVLPTEFDIATIPHRLKAPDTKFAVSFTQGDPKELFIAINELSHALKHTYDATLACYWIEWIIGYTGLCRKRKIALLCTPREATSAGCRPTDVAWLLWDVILSESLNDLQSRTLSSLLSMFRVKYKHTTSTKRIHVLYCAVHACNPSFLLSDSLDHIASGMKEAESQTSRMYRSISTASVVTPTYSTAVSGNPDLLLSRHGRSC